MDFATDVTNAMRDFRIPSEDVTVLLTALTATSAGIFARADASSERGITLSTWLDMTTSTGFQGLFATSRMREK
jgi:hypothetical protein